MSAPATVLFVVALAGFGSEALASPTGLVIDRARALDERSIVELEATLESIQAETGVRSRLVILRDLGGEDASDVATRFVDPGDGDQAVLLLAMADREVRVETAGPLADRVPDHVWSDMLSAEMLPELRAVRHGAAVRQGLQGMRGVLVGDMPRAEPPTGNIAGLRDVGLVATVALLLSLGLFPRSRARIVGQGRWR